MHGQPADPVRAAIPPVQWGGIVAWFVIGCSMAFAIQLFAVRWHGQGHWAWLLHCAESKAARHLIEQELGPLGPGTDLGHDGEYYYLIARDPFGKGRTPNLLIDSGDNPQYRYRRILFPALAGGFGTFSPGLTLRAMILLTIIGFGLTMAAIADLARQYGRDLRPLIASFGSPGFISSVGLVVADPLAVGAALVGYACYGRGRIALAAIWLTAAVLTRETMVLFVASVVMVSLTRKRFAEAFRLGLPPAIALGGWEIWSRSNILAGPDAFAKNMDLPFVGIVEALSAWAAGHDAMDRADIAMIAFGMANLILALVIAARSHCAEISVPLVIWALFAACLSVDVWGKAINALRVAAPLWILTMLGVERWSIGHDSKRT